MVASMYESCMVWYGARTAVKIHVRMMSHAYAHILFPHCIYIYIYIYMIQPPWFPPTPPPKGGIRHTYAAMYRYNYMFVLIYVCMPVCLSVCLSVCWYVSMCVSQQGRHVIVFVSAHKDTTCTHNVPAPPLWVGWGGLTICSHV